MLLFCSIDLNTAESLCEQKWLPLDWLLSSNVVSKLDAIQLKSLNASFENSSHVNSLSLYKCVIQTLIRRFRQNKPFTLSPTKIGANLFNKPFGGFVTLLFDRRFICFSKKKFFFVKKAAAWIDETAVGHFLCHVIKWDSWLFHCYSYCWDSRRID